LERNINVVFVCLIRTSYADTNTAFVTDFDTEMKLHYD